MGLFERIGLDISGKGKDGFLTATNVLDKSCA